MEPLSVKNADIPPKLNPQSQKTSNFEVETEDPRILRSRLETLVYMYKSGNTGLFA